MLRSAIGSDGLLKTLAPGSEIARNLPEFLTLQEDALLKVGEGLTTLQEVVSNAPRDIKSRDYATLRKIGGYGRKG